MINIVVCVTHTPQHCDHIDGAHALQALDLGRRSDADPRGLLEKLGQRGMAQELAVNDLEQPAFDMCAFVL